MKVLVIGSGGREHALAWKLHQSPRVNEVLVAPGNAGTAREAGLSNMGVAATDIDGLLQLAQEERIDLTVVGPEVPLVAGIVDRFQAAGLRIFGPSRAAAQLEGSKAFSKAFLARHRIPTADYAVFEQVDPALAWLRERGAPIVVKADGLAAGKGVVVAETLEQAEDAVRDMLAENRLGDAGARVVIEEFLIGEEASYIVMANGTQMLPLATSQDHKRRDDGDLGPNTGGMGAYSPAPVVTAAIEERILNTVIRPTLQAMVDEGTPFCGFLYAGLMIAPDGQIKVLEFNVRFGDPETQPIMLRLRSDLFGLIDAALNGKLDRSRCEWDSRAALAVVLAADGYPESPRRGDRISGLDFPVAEQCKVFHAGTRLEGERVLTAGGRVLTVCALGDRLDDAASRAYALAERINWSGRFFRRDIGHRAL